MNIDGGTDRRKGQDMTNTDYLYRAMQDFTNARAANRRVYMEQRQRLERYSGSEGHKTELDAAMKTRKEADAAARAKCAETVGSAIRLMQDANNRRGLTPPTPEMVQMLSVVNMMDKPPKATLDAVANSLGGNALALSALQDIAKRKYENDPSIPNYTARATKELGADVVSGAIRNLQKVCGEIMNSSGANRTRELTASRHTQLYGGSFDPDDLPQEEPYDSERDFYKRELSVDYDLFAKAVND